MTIGPKPRQTSSVISTLPSGVHPNHNPMTGMVKAAAGVAKAMSNMAINIPLNTFNISSIFIIYCPFCEDDGFDATVEEIKGDDDIFTLTCHCCNRKARISHGILQLKFDNKPLRDVLK